MAPYDLAFGITKQAKRKINSSSPPRVRKGPGHDLAAVGGDDGGIAIA